MPTSTTWPAYALITACPEELLAYVETKAIVGGTTTVQGSPPQNRPRDGWLVRNVEDESFGTGDREPHLRVDVDGQGAGAGRPGRSACATARCSSTTAPRVSRAAWWRASGPSAANAGCLQPTFVAVHANAVDPTVFAGWTSPGGDRLVAAVEHVALRADHRRARGPRGRGHGVPRLGLGAVGHQARARRGQGRAAGVRPPRLGSQRCRPGAHGDLQPGRPAGPAWGRQLGRLQPGAIADLVVIHAKPRRRSRSTRS